MDARTFDRRVHKLYLGSVDFEIYTTVINTGISAFNYSQYIYHDGRAF